MKWMIEPDKIPLLVFFVKDEFLRFLQQTDIEGEVIVVHKNKLLPENCMLMMKRLPKLMKTEAAAGAGRQIVNGLSHVEISGRLEFIDSHDVRIASVALIPDSFPNVKYKEKV